MCEVKAVIFDLDGTLTQSEEGIWNCICYAARKMGFQEPDAAALRKFVGPPLYHSFRSFMGMTDDQALRAVEFYRERYTVTGLFENRVYPGIRHLLLRLKKAGCWLGVATGKPQPSAERVLAYFGLDKFFDAICGTDTKDTSSDKSGLIRRALPEQPVRAVMVGDRKFDIQGAKHVGIEGVGVGYGYGDEAELREADCDAYAATVADLEQLLCAGTPCPAGYFLSMEGLDGSGKTTQMNLLEERLLRYGFEVRRSREPGGCAISEKIRDLLLDPANREMDAVTEAILYAAARAQHVHQVIRPTVAKGQLMLCDRFVDSSVAYQGGGRQLGVQKVLDINAPAVEGMMPGATVWLDVDHVTALKRRSAAAELDRIELEQETFHGRVEAAYRALIAREPERFLVVDASRPAEQVAEDVWSKVFSRLTEAEV